MHSLRSLSSRAATLGSRPQTLIKAYAGTPEDIELQNATARANATALRIDTKGRHIFLCTDATKPKCCPKAESLESWEFLKRRLKALGLEQQGPVWRSKVDCLRICGRGPVAVVYPDQVYYHSCSPAVLERIIQEHLLGGCTVEQFRITQAGPAPTAATPPASSPHPPEPPSPPRP